jgi:hypothetical protein
MEKFKTKLAFVFVLCGILSVAAFAEGDDSNSQGGGSSPTAQTEDQKAREDTAKNADDEQKAKEDAAKKTAAEPKAKEDAVKKAAAEPKAREDAAKKVAAEQKNREEAEKKAAEEQKAKEEAEKKAIEETQGSQDEEAQKQFENNNKPVSKSRNESEEALFSMSQLSPLLLAVAAIALVLLALAALNFIAIGKICKRIPALIQTKFDEISKKQDDAKQTILEKIGSRYTAVENTRIPSAQDTAQSAAQIERLQSEINRLKTEKTGLEAENRSLKENKRIAEGIKSGSLDPVSVFNDWASYPSAPLPRDFYYIEGDMKILTSQEFHETNNSESKWITNRSGQKYLLPNPKSFNPMIKIGELYKMDEAKLNKPKGSYKIKITKACKMTENGFVESQGELEIL